MGPGAASLVLSYEGSSAASAAAERVGHACVRARSAVSSEPMRLPPELKATRPLKPGTVVVHKNAVGLETYGIIVSEVAGTFQIAYPSRLHRRVRVVPLEDFAPLEQIGVPVAAELQPEDPILTARRALAMDGQALSLIGSNTAEFLSLCLQGVKETHHIDKLKVTLARVATGTIVASLVHDIGAAIGQKLRGARRRRR